MKKTLRVTILQLSLLSLLMVHAGVATGAERGPVERPQLPQRGLIGTWRVQITLRVCESNAAIRPPFSAMATFAAGGTMTTADSGFNPALRSAGHGVWRHDDGHTYIAKAEAFLFNMGGTLTATQKLSQTIEVGPDGKTFHATVASTVVDLAGNVLLTGCASSVGERMQ